MQGSLTGRCSSRTPRGPRERPRTGRRPQRESRLPFGDSTHRLTRVPYGSPSVGIQLPEHDRARQDIRSPHWTRRRGSRSIGKRAEIVGRGGRRGISGGCQRHRYRRTSDRSRTRRGCWLTWRALVVEGDTFSLALSDELSLGGQVDSSGAPLAVVVDAVLARGFAPSDFQQRAGYRVCDYKRM
jgi:hypothetical protein